MTFNHFNETRTCPACGGTLRAYADEDLRIQVLACMGCLWGAGKRVPEDGPEGEQLICSTMEQVARDRREYAELTRVFEKGGA